MRIVRPKTLLKMMPRIVPSEISCGFGAEGADGLTSSIPVVETFTLTIVAAISVETLAIVDGSLLRSQAKWFVTRRGDCADGSIAMAISSVKSGPIGIVSVRLTEIRVALIPRRGAR